MLTKLPKSVLLAVIFILFTDTALSFAQITGRTQPPAGKWLLWYGQPAEKWEEALPIGNGHMGGMVFGRVGKERIQFNEDTLWAGHPMDYQNPGAHNYLQEIRELLFAGKQREAEKLAGDHFMGVPLRQCAFQPFADLNLEFPGHEAASDYARSLDLDDAIARTVYRVGEVSFSREIFASYPRRAMVVRITANRPGQVTFKATLTSLHKQSEQLAIDDHTLAIRGQVTHTAENSEESRLRFEGRLQVRTEGGQAEITNEGISITKANAVTLILTAATSYNNYQDISGDPAAKAAELMQRSDGMAYQALKTEHVADHQRLFRRVDIDLGRTPAADKETDQRIQAFKGGDDPQLAALYFQFGRYLLIACSRPGSQPGNLQGVWNDKLSPPWGCKYTININTEMNYWPAEMTNLSECTEPLFDLIEDCSHAGALTAKNFYNARGWVIHHNTEIWRGTAPINASNHGIWPTGGAWLAQHLWWHYQYTGDKEFLRRRGYPLLKSASEFFVDYLVDDPVNGKGWLVSGPSNSPERGGLVMGPTMDHQIIRYLFAATAEAARVLEVDADFRATLLAMHGRIAPNQVGKAGQLKEWLYTEDPFTDHRHISHLWGLHPGEEITRDGTPELYAAARKSLELRGDGGTGWSMGWKINCWARLHDGDHAYLMLSNQLTPQKTYPNLFDAHPPFQIDGNFGATSGIGEMIMQSHTGRIELLPALPAALASGRISGLCARGGFELDLVWEDGQLVTVDIRSKLGNPCVVACGDKSVRLKTRAGQSILLEGPDLKIK